MRIQEGEDGSGFVVEILPRRNFFLRPAVANIDCLVMVAAAVNPVTDPFLIDRVWAMAEHHRCGMVLCVNKADLDPGESLAEIYRAAGRRLSGQVPQPGKEWKAFERLWRGRSAPSQATPAWENPAS